MEITIFRVINGVTTYFYDNGWKAQEVQKFYWYIYNDKRVLMRVIYGSDFELSKELKRLEDSM